MFVAVFGVVARHSGSLWRCGGWCWCRREGWPRRRSFTMLSHKIQLTALQVACFRMSASLMLIDPCINISLSQSKTPSLASSDTQAPTICQSVHLTSLPVTHYRPLHMLLLRNIGPFIPLCCAILHPVTPQLPIAVLARPCGLRLCTLCLLDRAETLHRGSHHCTTRPQSLMKCLKTEAHWGLIWPFVRKTVLQVVKDSLHRIYTYHLVMTQAEQENTSSHYIRDDTSASLAHNGISFRRQQPCPRTSLPPEHTSTHTRRPRHRHIHRSCRQRILLHGRARPRGRLRAQQVSTNEEANRATDAVTRHAQTHTRQARRHSSEVQRR
jgi:hypothetical protein